MTSRLCRDKGVVVVVYAEKRRHRNVDGRVRRYKYNTRAELLDHARHLRPPPAPQSHPPSHIKQPASKTQVLAAEGTRKQNHSNPPTCFDKWSFEVTRFLRSITAPKTTKDKQKRNHKKNVSAMAKMKKALVNSLEVKKRGSFLSKLLTALKRRR